MEFYIMIVKLIFALVVVFGLIFIIYKTSGNQVANMQNGKYIKVIERTQVSKDTTLLVVKIGEEGCIMSSSPNNTQKVQDLSKEEINSIEVSKKRNLEKSSEIYKDIYQRIKVRFQRKNDNE